MAKAAGPKVLQNDEGAPQDASEIRVWPYGGLSAHR